MDELLSFMEEGLEDEATTEDVEGKSQNSRSPLSSSDKHKAGSSSSSSRSRSTSSKSITKDKDELTFDDVFGSPDKRDVKDLGLLSSASSAECRKRLSLGGGMGTFPGSGSSSSRPSAGSSISSSSTFVSGSGLSSLISSDQLELSRAIKSDKNVPYRPDTTQVVIDPYSRVRIVKKSISIYFDETVSAEAVLKDRNIGLEFVNLASFNMWYRGKGKDCKNFWVSGVLVKKTAGVRKSAKGNDYGIWEISDLRDLDKRFTVFLFGSASSSSTLLATPAGSLVDITTPSVMHDSSNGTSKFSINNGTQVRLIATSKDFGYCQATKKDGNKCTAVVNTWECSFCIHHAAGELKKLNIGAKKGKGKGKANGGPGGLFPNKSFHEGESEQSLKQQGIFIADFGAARRGALNTSKSFMSNLASPSSRVTALPNSRMELQGVANEMKKNSLKIGNPDSVKFIKNSDHHLFKNDPLPAPVRKSLDLNPLKTRHLTDKDRDLLKLLEGGSTPTTGSKEAVETSSKSQAENKPSSSSSSTGTVSEFIATSIVGNPNAASRNFLQYLQLQHAPRDQVDLNSANKSNSIQPLVMSREKVKSMEKALAFVKKNGPIQKANPNAVVTGKKRKFQQISQNESGGSQSSSQGSSKKRNSTKIDVEFDFESEEFKKILNAKSAHDDELDSIQHEEYFGKLEKKEALENKLLSTYSIDTNAVMCRQCKYVALSQSEFCKEQMHEVRVVKARKRFFKCKDCGNRTMSLERLPKRACTNCKSSNWLVAPVGKERKGPTLPSEMLSVRGNEEKFVGSAGSKMFLHLEA